MLKRIATLPARIRGHVPLIALVVLVMITSIVLMPGPRDRAARELKSRRTLDAIALLESLAASGDRSTWTLTTLARAREEAGEIEGAIEALELLLHERPDSIHILSLLADMYKGAGFPEQQLTSLQKLQTLSSSAERQRLIVHLLGELGREEEQIAALRVLTTQFDGNRDEYLLLARIEASVGRPSEAATTLQSFSTKLPESTDGKILSWEMALWNAAGHTKYAIERGRTWLDSSGRMKDAATLAEAFTTRSLHEATVALLEPYASRSASPEIFLILAGAEYDIGSSSSALQRLSQFEAVYGSSERLDVKRMHLQLALRVDSIGRSLELADAIGVESLSPDLLSSMASVALRAHRLDILSKIRQDIGGSFTSLDPLSRAKVHFALGEISAAQRLAGQIAEQSAGDPIQMVGLANLQLRMGRRDQALASLRSITGVASPGIRAAWEPSTVKTGSLPTVPSLLLRDIGRLYIQAGASHEARQFFEQIRHRDPSPEADQAWAMAAIMSSHGSKVKAWLSETETSLTPDMLQELIYTSANVQAYGLASDLAKLLVDRRGTDADRLLLAEVRIAAGRPWVQISMPAPAVHLRPNPVSLIDRFR